MIFKSKQVNTDPKPWRNPNDGERRSHGVKWVSGPDMFDPRPEFNVTRDREPWALRQANGTDIRMARREDFMPITVGIRFDPRPEYDHPVNRILVAFRERSRGLDAAASWYTALSLAWRPVADASPDETEHAMKVLLRLVGWSA